MQSLIAIELFFMFMFGACLGSFGNVLIYRIPRRIHVTSDTTSHQIKETPQQNQYLKAYFFCQIIANNSCVILCNMI